MNDKLRGEVVDVVRSRMKIAVDSQSPIIDIIEDVALETQEQILNYLNRPDMPEGLKYTWVRLIMGVVASEWKNETEVSALNPASVTSIKEGDAQINFGGSTSANTSAVIGSAVRNIESQLNRYRKMGNRA